MSPAGRFPSGPVRAQELAERVGGHGVGLGDVVLYGVAPLGEGGPDDLVWCAGRVPPSCSAGVILSQPVTDCQYLDTPRIEVKDPLRAFALVLRTYFPEAHPVGVHPTAVVEPSARLGKNVVIGAFAYVGHDVEIGDETVVFPHVTLYPHTQIGRRCRIHAGSVLGADGFRYVPGPAGLEKVPQIGRVVLEDDVEVGANTCIDRAGLGETRIGQGAKIDNLVQVGHNCVVGSHAVLAGQVGLAGSVTIGSGAMLGGQAGVADHRRVGHRARVGAQSGVARDVGDGEVVLGSPALPIRLARRWIAKWRRGID